MDDKTVENVTTENIKINPSTSKREKKLNSNFVITRTLEKDVKIENFKSNKTTRKKDTRLR